MAIITKKQRAKRINKAFELISEYFIQQLYVTPVK